MGHYVPCHECGTPLHATARDRAQLAAERLNAYCRDCIARLDHGDGT